MIFKRFIEHAKYVVKRIFYSVKVERQMLPCNIFEDSANMILFINHNFKGGTLQYEKNFMEKANNNVISVKIITHSKILAYSVENKKTGSMVLLDSHSFTRILENPFREVVVNSLVSANNFAEILNALCEFKKKNPFVPITYLIHDFHCICPKYNLVPETIFCNLECERYRCKFHFYPDCTNIGIVSWRNSWNSFLTAIDKIICFSESSKNLILRAYPDITESRLIVRPHDMSWCHFSPLHTTPEPDFTSQVAIIGTCNTIPKGKRVIQEILKTVSEKIRFYMIGTNSHEIKTKRKNIFFYGRYQHDELENILEAMKISLVVFPSVCPETFSYLVSELILMELPIVCFDYGAQAEKVCVYKKGKVVSNTQEMISYIESFGK